jgi:uncharacterized protein with beta-barrel porin domain
MTVTAPVTGGSGVSAGVGSFGLPGGGGGGGAGLTLDNAQGIYIINASVSGGDGGSGTVRGGGGGGGGGAGIIFKQGGSLTLGNGASVTGGNGGADALGADGGNGSGGAGPGSGGVGILGAAAGGTSIVNSGLIAGGTGYGDQANAISLFGSDNTLKLQYGSAIVGHVVVSGGGTNNILALGGETDSSFDVSKIGQQYQGFDTFEKIGASKWTLTGTNNFSGANVVAEGTLIVNGSLGGSTAVLSHGTLAGSGTVATSAAGGPVSNTVIFGTIAPGDGSIGTLNVSGNLLFLDGSHYEVEVDATGHSDQIIVSGGTNFLGNSTVDVLNASGSYAPGTRYTILTANGGVLGDFAGLTLSSPLSTPFLSFGLEQDALNDPDNIYLAVARSSVTFASVGQTPNQIAVGGALDSLSSSNPLVAALAQLDTPAANAAFNQLSGEVHASTKSALIEDSHFVRDAIDNRIRSAFHGACAGPG